MARPAGPSPARACRVEGRPLVRHRTRTTTGSPRPLAGRVGAGSGKPPAPHPLWSRLDSPLSTYYLLIGSAGALLVDRPRHGAVGLERGLDAASPAARTSMFVEPGAVRRASASIAGRRRAPRARRTLAADRVPAAACVAMRLQLLVFTPLGHRRQRQPQLAAPRPDPAPALGARQARHHPVRRRACCPRSASCWPTGSTRSSRSSRRSGSCWSALVLARPRPGHRAWCSSMILGAVLWAAGISARLLRVAGRGAAPGWS